MVLDVMNLVTVSDIGPFWLQILFVFATVVIQIKVCFGRLHVLQNSFLAQLLVHLEEDFFDLVELGLGLRFKVFFIVRIFTIEVGLDAQIFVNHFDQELV